jgi:hypothetical protein
MNIYERAEKGAKLLDEKVPGWAAIIDLEKLKMDSMRECVLGQIFGHFLEGQAFLFGRDWPDYNDDARSHGFYPHFTEVGVPVESLLEIDEMKNEIWTNFILRRR